MTEGAEPVVGFDLTTHQGHFTALELDHDPHPVMGLGHHRLVQYTFDGRAWVRAVGTLDPMPWHLDQAYRRGGRAAQQAVRGQGGDERLRMLHQLARCIA